MLPSDLILVGKCLYFVLCNGNFKHKIDIFQRELSNKLCCGVWRRGAASILPSFVAGSLSLYLASQTGMPEQLKALWWWPKGGLSVLWPLLSQGSAVACGVP